MYSYAPHSSAWFVLGTCSFLPAKVLDRHRIYRHNPRPSMSAGGASGDEDHAILAGHLSVNPPLGVDALSISPSDPLPEELLSPLWLLVSTLLSMLQARDVTLRFELDIRALLQNYRCSMLLTHHMHLLQHSSIHSSFHAGRFGYRPSPSSGLATIRFSPIASLLIWLSSIPPPPPPPPPPHPRFVLGKRYRRCIQFPQQK